MGIPPLTGFGGLKVSCSEQKQNNHQANKEKSPVTEKLWTQIKHYYSLRYMKQQPNKTLRFYLTASE